MAENPATWGRAELVVVQVLRKHQENRRLPPEERPIGLSLVRMITDALREEGLLREPAEPPPSGCWTEDRVTHHAHSPTDICPRGLG